MRFNVETCSQKLDFSKFPPREFRCFAFCLSRLMSGMINGSGSKPNPTAQNQAKLDKLDEATRIYNNTNILINNNVVIPGRNVPFPNSMLAPMNINNPINNGYTNPNSYNTINNLNNLNNINSINNPMNNPMNTTMVNSTMNGTINSTNANPNYMSTQGKSVLNIGKKPLETPNYPQKEFLLKPNNNPALKKNNEMAVYDENFWEKMINLAENPNINDGVIRDNVKQKKVEKRKSEFNMKEAEVGTQKKVKREENQVNNANAKNYLVINKNVGTVMFIDGFRIFW